MNYKETKIDENHYVREWNDGFKIWCKNGEEHRLDGPAAEYPDGYKKWYIDGQMVFNLYNNMITFSNIKPSILNNKHFIFNNIYLLNQESK